MPIENRNHVGMGKDVQLLSFQGLPYICQEQVLVLLNSLHTGQQTPLPAERVVNPEALLFSAPRLRLESWLGYLLIQPIFLTRFSTRLQRICYLAHQFFSRLTNVYNDYARVCLLHQKENSSIYLQQKEQFNLFATKRNLIYLQQRKDTVC